MILVTYHFARLTTFGKVHCFRIKLTFEPAPSVVSFLPGLALIKRTVLECFLLGTGRMPHPVGGAMGVALCTAVKIKGDKPVSY